MTSAASPRRLVSLDVLRGLAILLMILSGLLPKSLPNWVDHGYQPHYRPDASGAWVSTLVNGNTPFDPRWKAFTWVDLVFPMFLFAMGAAIPLAMSRRLDEGQSKRRAIGTIVGRTATLALFAVVATQMTTSQLSWPTASPDATRGRVMTGLVGTLLFFTRWQRPAHAIAARAAGATILLSLVLLGVRRGATFAWGESDTIILVLAHTYLFAATLWVLTRDWRWLRLLAVAPLLMLAHYRQFADVRWSDWRWMGDLPLVLSEVMTKPADWLNVAAWIDTDRWSTQARALLNLSPLWNVTWYKFLWCVVPGTIVGDLLLRRPPVPEDDLLPRRTILALSVAVTAATCVGFRHYGFPLLGLGGPLATPWLAITLTLPPLLAMTLLVRRSIDPTHRALTRVGATSLAIGIALACLPDASAREGFFEGGISKGSPATLSYYATSVGLCTLLLLGLLAVFDDPRRPPRACPGVVAANGQNPLLAYFLAHTTLHALFTFSVFASANVAIAKSPALGTGVGVAKTTLVAAIVWAVTRRRIFWRA